MIVPHTSGVAVGTRHRHLQHYEHKEVRRRVCAEKGEREVRKEGEREGGDGGSERGGGAVYIVHVDREERRESFTCEVFVGSLAMVEYM